MPLLCWTKLSPCDSVLFRTLPLLFASALVFSLPFQHASVLCYAFAPPFTAGPNAAVPCLCVTAQADLSFTATSRVFSAPRFTFAYPCVAMPPPLETLALVATLRLCKFPLFITTPSLTPPCFPRHLLAVALRLTTSHFIAAAKQFHSPLRFAFALASQKITALCNAADSLSVSLHRFAYAKIIVSMQFPCRTVRISAMPFHGYAHLSYAVASRCFSCPFVSMPALNLSLLIFAFACFFRRTLTPPSAFLSSAQNSSLSSIHACSQSGCTSADTAPP